MNILNSKIGKVTKTSIAKYDKNELVKEYNDYIISIKVKGIQDTSYNFLCYLMYANTNRT